MTNCPQPLVANAIDFSSTLLLLLLLLLGEKTKYDVGLVP
jgi:hypothetical protein